MTIKSVAICVYIVLIYWISMHVPIMHTLFFPTLGAFSLLFISKPFKKDIVGKVALGAITASLIGSLCMHFSTGVLSILLNTVAVMWLIRKFKWNAPPILAVSFIPFFTQPSTIWITPLSVAVSLLGLLLFLYTAVRLERKFGEAPLFIRRSTEQESPERAAM
ncbi:hypothetical protein [Paenibacillus sp. YIM B09110]|uniref:hypothetical protein n=1 Tax=Paenibacillus sp. YIM B09110 TaxID=3126102 RepID=UPI00301DDB06